MHLHKLIVALCIASCSSTVLADCRNATSDQIESQKTKALADPAAKVAEEEGYLKVTLPQASGDIIISYFALPGHPAYPSNVISAIYRHDGKIWLYSRGFNAGDCAAFQSWMQGFAAQHERVRSEMQERIREN